MKITRLLEITIILLNKGTVTAKELADRFGVSKRTIYRDIDVLSSASVPVFTNKGKGGGISLMESYSLNKTLISEQESESLMLALKTLQATKYPEIDIVLDKIGALFNNVDSTDWVYIDFSAWGSKPNENEKFINIKKAILQRKLIRFDYLSSEGVRSSRSIEPMRMVFKSNAWYLWGYCKAREDFRTFRISRMKNVVLTNEAFERKNPASYKTSEANEELKKPVKLKLKFYPQALYRLYDAFEDDVIIKNPDGTYTVSFSFLEDEWLYGLILSFGCYVEVLEPNSIREAVKEKLNKALDIYKVSEGRGC
ncbi:YafY family transcriptional regulator [Alkaliphilus pronyensis]|uniref:YafY family transcriptional regulator n=1 Tax=Alkaliphilus pronyensis TaxID=1482732 RepID=A0A6I0EXA2_9FIRM|nr:YafY family protein [Alkaliphilus pronyensis]KAB3533454.1 YafY family transcriptional regulator [Alkaliphilus pronyensis]